MSLIYLKGDETANHVNFMQPMLSSYSSRYFSALEGNIRKESNFQPLETSLSLFLSIIILQASYVVRRKDL